ncbi:MULTISPECIES: dihydrolipoyl dehydrogenase [unclassified Haladaptatus]|uniref:dihydrolipoyl dehydrogenase n=1 Tax=unclassified Haladaptatus TaxID=2622732 RepID=UPI00209BDA3A|nr:MULTISPECIES: dihydrolipoyl dehydrogenase [unclassified Haladaptatus]MCO8242500.1 dihydrolipoyl dehydrogenase [Haladaptatus sp. AB643]MCO8252257.1 dihydrolipoyl dehydrogenase [Haladaptatus sp. AB618]
MVVGDISTGTEVLVIGAGPGGYVAAIRAGQLGLDVTLVEKDAYGGVCLNYGCIPSKAMITASDLAYDASHAEDMGIYTKLDVNYGEMVEWKDGVVSQLTGGVEKLCKANGVTLMEGRAEFADDGSVRVVHEGEGQGSETVEFEHAIISTGSRPIEIPGFEFDGEHVLDSRMALAMDDVPESIVIVGAGYIGMELAGVLAKLGSDVTVVEMLDSVLPAYEDDLARPVKKKAEELGIDFHFGQAAKEWEESGDGITVRTEDEDGEVSEFGAEKVLVAVGRRPVTDTLDLESAGIETNEMGFIETDDRARTEKDNIYAIGDVAGEPMLAHKASKEGQVAAEVIAGEPSALDYQAMPAAVFTDPEIGTVGLTEDEAEEQGFEPVVGRFPFQASGRALTTGHSDGFVRIIADEPSGFVLGAQIVGPEASELIAELGMAIEMGATLEDLAATIHTHPTLSEAVMECAENALGHAIHTLNR